TDPKTYVSSVSTQTVNTNRQKPTNRNLLRELNLQTNQTQFQFSIASNIETCSNLLSPKKRNNLVLCHVPAQLIRILLMACKMHQIAET
ncbi:hypothetical protein BpHYR1_006147, partial [Brachionus plicatilis]